MTLKPLNRTTANAPVRYPERVVQFGGGNFLRGFVDWMIEILNEQAGFDSSIVIVKVTPRGGYDELDAQEGLFHVHLQGMLDGKEVSETRLITCVSRTVYPYQDYASYLALAEQPEIRFLISNTTEAGISYSEGDQFSDQPASSFPAKLTQFLYHRYQHFDGDPSKGCNIIPTELIVQNGTQLRDIILRYADQWGLESGFREWIKQHNLFCNTLVDRIVSGFPKAQSDALLQQIGYDDQLLTMGEPYNSWIIEAPHHLKDELPIDQTDLGIRVVDDADPYRQTKVRILNGAHSSMTWTGLLLGFDLVRQCVEHPTVDRFLRDLVYDEIIPSMDLPQDDLKDFAQATFDRFRNPHIEHHLRDIALNSTSKFRARMVPTLLGYQQKTGRLPRRVVLVFAALIRLYKGEWQGETITLKDDPAAIEWFQQQWQDANSPAAVVDAVLKNNDLWGEDLSAVPGLRDQLTDDLTRIDQGELMALMEAVNETES